MNDIVLYLESQPALREILFIMDSHNGIKIMKDIFKGMRLDKITIYTSTKEILSSINRTLEKISADPDFLIPEKININDIDNLQSYRKSHEEVAIVFENITNCNLINSLSAINPKYLVGICNTKYLNSFDIWERFRSNTENIYLISSLPDTEPKICKWTRDAHNDIELSIIFPMYNIAQYLPQCIETVTAWRAEYIEYLFVDDGSPDNCADIVCDYAKKDPRIKLLRKKNGGCASARQYGLEHSKGQYIGFIDPDDFIDPYMYRKLLSKALEGTYEIAYCGYQEYYENTGTSLEVSDPIGLPYSQGTCDPNKINELIGYQRIAIWRGIYSRSLITRNKIHFYTDLRRFDDLPFKVEILSKTRSVVAVPEYLYYYRMSRPGQSVLADDDRLYVHFSIFKYLDQSIRNSSDRRQLDYLQLVKVHTHKYALEKIKKEFSKEYCSRAKKDIRSNFGLIEGTYIIQKLGSKYDVLFYILLYFGFNGIIRKLKNHHIHHDMSLENSIKKLKLLNPKNI